MRVAFVNMGCYRDRQGASIFNEPVHLLAMHNACRARGHESRVFQFGYPSDRASKREITAYRPEVIGLSFIGRSAEAVAKARRLINGLPGQRPQLLLGGTDVKYHGSVYRDAFRYYQPRSSDGKAVVVLVPDAGEGLVNALAEHDFNFFPAIKSLNARTKVEVQREGGMFWLNSSPGVPLDQQSFDREAVYPMFGEQANVKWQTGCWGSCSFCPNEFGALDYLSLNLIQAEIKALQAKGVLSVKITSPNFTANPGKASAIVQMLPPLEGGYHFFSRVDSLYRAINDHPTEWQKFALGTQRIGLGVERLGAAGLMRLGKYSSLAKAEKQTGQLDHILNFFDGKPVVFDFFLIPFDWRSSIEELENEMRELQRLQIKYPWGVRIGFDQLYNNVEFAAGSRLARKMPPWEFYRFQDPRLLMLALVLREQSVKIFSDLKDNPHFKSAATRLMFKYIFVCLEIMKTIPPDRLSVEPAVEGSRNRQDHSVMLRSFYRQFGFWERVRLKRLFAREFSKIFCSICEEAEVTLSEVISSSLRGHPDRDELQKRILEKMLADWRRKP